MTWTHIPYLQSENKRIFILTYVFILHIIWLEWKHLQRLEVASFWGNIFLFELSAEVLHLLNTDSRIVSRDANQNSSTNRFPNCATHSFLIIVV